MFEVNHYEILEVSETATQDEIRVAYKKLALKHHPDRNPGNAQAEIEFRKVTESFQILSDDGKRTIYDYDRRKSVEPKIDFSKFAHASAAGKNPFDIFSEMFEQTDFSPFKHARQRSAASTQDVFQKEQPGDDVLITLELTLEESVAGCKKSVTVKGPRPNVRCGSCNGIGTKPGGRKIVCSSCAGNGKTISSNGKGVRNCPVCGGGGSVPLERCFGCGGNGKVIYTKDIVVQVPAGMSSDQQLRISGQGTPGHPPGNLFITIKVAPSKLFWRDGLNIHTNKRISLKHAILGGPIVFNGINGDEINMNVPPGTQPGSTISASGAGVSGPLSKVNGDMIVHLEIMIPKNLTDRARKLLEDFTDELARGPQPD